MLNWAGTLLFIKFYGSTVFMCSSVSSCAPNYEYLMFVNGGGCAHI